MDPWLAGAIRLADRRGLFRDGRPLSRVQAFAVESLLIQELADQGEDFSRQLRMAVLSHDPSNITMLFPEFDEDAEVTEENVDEVLADESGVELSFTQEVTQADVEAAMALLGAQTLTMADVVPTGEWS